jgi:hypothetical protein
MLTTLVHLCAHQLSFVVALLQDITSGTITSVFRTLVHSNPSVADTLSALFDVPVASSLSSREVCDLILLAVRKGGSYLEDLSQ